MDERAKALASIVVDYSVCINKDDHLIVDSEPDFREFAGCIRDLAEAKGAVVTYLRNDLKSVREMVERNDPEELKNVAEKLCGLYKIATAFVGIDATMDPFSLDGIDPKKIADYGKLVKKPISNIVVGDGKENKGYKWNLVAYPCEPQAKLAGMSIGEYSDFVFGATNIDWSKTAKQMGLVKDVFNGVKDVHIFVPGYTDLHLSLEGRGGSVCDGRFNMPDGEVFYGPVEDSAEGCITFPYEYVMSGQSAANIRLEYKCGEVVSFSAEKNQGFLETMLALSGVKRIGEFGIGCNYGIRDYTKNLLFDEKIGGTVHLAIGDSYKEPLDNGGGKNEGEIHWDLVCELRKINGFPGGEIYVDGKLVQKDGFWTF